MIPVPAEVVKNIRSAAFEGAGLGITDCPYCGFHEKQKLGLSKSGEL
ncbi:MAG: hypothetical protein ACJA16_004970 [Akkermansiaceae bacterium]|jgi:hypothetical protein